MHGSGPGNPVGEPIPTQGVQKTVTLDPDAKPPIFPTPALNPKFESSAKQFQLSPAGTAMLISPVPPAVTVGAAVAMPAPTSITGAMTAEATAVRNAILFIVLTFDSKKVPTRIGNGDAGPTRGAAIASTAYFAYRINTRKFHQYDNLLRIRHLNNRPIQLDK
ncbi:hypothetical protein [Rhodococcus opacus]